MEREAGKAQFVGVSLVGSDGEIRIAINQADKTPSMHKDVSLWICRSWVMKEITGDASGELVEPKIIHISVVAPGLSGDTENQKDELQKATICLNAFISRIRQHPLQKARIQRWNWRPKHFPAREDYYQHLCRYVGVSQLMPRLATRQLEVGVVVPIASFGGAEKVAYAMAQYLRQEKNARVHLFVLGAPVMKVLSEFTDAFDTITFLADPDFPSWGGPLTIYGQECFPPDSDALKVADIAGLMSGLDLVVNCHSAPLNALMGRLRQQERAKTETYLHVFDYTPLRRPVGHPYLTVAFEHAYDLVLTCSRKLADEVHSLGVPEAKILPIPNAAGFSVPHEKRAAIEQQRDQPRSTRALRIVYIGRLDPQKGIERVLDVAQRVRRARLNVDIRVVGASVIDGVGGWAGALKSAGVEIEPPIYGSEQLAEVFAWADVLLLPSRWEGAPLVIPECQQLGCIPLATNVGAVSELISDGVDGILIHTADDAVVADEAMQVIIGMLNNDGKAPRNGARSMSTC